MLARPCVADEVQCTDLPKDQLQFHYDLYDDGGTLEITMPEKYEEAVFSGLRADYGKRAKVTFWLQTERDDQGRISALIGVPKKHEILEVEATYGYPYCFALLHAKFVGGKRVE